MDRADRVIEFCQRYLRVPEGAQVGAPLKLADFQKEFIRDTYSECKAIRRAFLSIARKGGKSGLIAALLLAHLVGPEAKPNTQIISGARSRDQAALIFDLASKMVRFSPELSEIIRIVPSNKKLVGIPRNVEYRALAAEGKTAHGLSPVLAILDEVGQVTGPQDDFIDAITTSQGAHDDPLLIAISTQAPTDADLFSIWLDDARNSNDPHIVSHVYEAPADCELTDESAWRAANPALGIFRNRTDVEEQAKQAERMPSAEASFRNLVLNQRVNTTSPFISKSVWELNGNPPEHVEGMTYYGGLDLSSRTDLTAFILIGVKGKHVSVWPYIWTPGDTVSDRAHEDRQPYDVWAKQGFLRTTPGKTVDYEHVAADIAEACSDINLEALAFDRWRIDMFRRDCERIGVEFPLVPFGQGFKDMAPALDELEESFLNGNIAHGMHPVMTMCAANAVTVQDSAGNRKLDKAKSTGRIDGMVALAMAVGSANIETEDTGPSVYEDRGLVSL